MSHCKHTAGSVLVRARVTLARFVTVALSLVCTTQAFALGTVTATVTSIRIDQDGRGMVFFSQPISGAAGCVNAAYASALAFDSRTDGGKSILAVALAAKATGDTISVYGTGTCGLYGSSSVEDWSYGYIQ